MSANSVPPPVRKLADQDLAYGRFFVGVDCGGTGLRVLLMHEDGRVITRLTRAGQNLRNSVDRCWAVILDAITECFAASSLPFFPRHCMVGIGVAGGHHPGAMADFKARAPAFAALAIDTDSFILLLGAHSGRPGSIAAFGTGSIGESLMPDGTRRLIGGYGFPAGDRASGAWLGLQASRHLQDAIDGVIGMDALATALGEAMGVSNRAEAMQWLGDASPAAFARLAPVTLAHREHPTVARLLSVMARDAGTMLTALQLHHAGPVALCGGLAPVIGPLLPEALRRALVEPDQDGAAGAIAMVRSHAN